MTEVQRETIELREGHTLPETSGVRPHLDAMEGVAKVVANDTFPADNGGMVTIEASVHRPILWQLLGVGRGTLYGMWGSSLAREHCLLGLGSHVQERLEAIANRLQRYSVDEH